MSEQTDTTRADPGAKKSSATSNIRLLLRGVLSNWCFTALSVLYALFITPIVVRTLENELYGIWSFLNGLTAYSNLLYLGLGSAIVKYVARYRAEDRPEAIGRLVSVVLTIYTVLGVISLAASLLLVPFLGDLLTISQGETLRVAGLSCALLGVQLLLTFLTSVFVGTLQGHDRFDLAQGAQILLLVARFVLVYFFVGYGNPLVTLALITVVTTAAGTVLLWAVAAHKRPWIKPRLTIPTRSELSELYSFSLQAFLLTLAFQMINHTDTTVIGILFGAASVTLYALPQQLIAYARVAVGGFTSVFLPSLTVRHQNNDVAGLRTAYLATGRLACLISAFLIGNLVLLGAPFLRLWVGEEFGGSEARWIVLLLGTAAVLQVVTIQVPFAFYQAMGRMRVPSLVLFGEAFINIALSVVLGRAYGLIGVAVATVVPALLLSVVALPAYLCRLLELPMMTAFRRIAVPALVLAFALALLHTFVTPALGSTSFFRLGLRFLCSVPVSACVLIVLLTPEEKTRLLTFLTRRRRERVRQPA